MRIFPWHSKMPNPRISLIDFVLFPGKASNLSRGEQAELINEALERWSFEQKQVYLNLACNASENWDLDDFSALKDQTAVAHVLLQQSVKDPDRLIFYWRHHLKNAPNCDPASITVLTQFINERQNSAEVAFEVAEYFLNRKEYKQAYKFFSIAQERHCTHPLLSQKLNHSLKLADPLSNLSLIASELVKQKKWTDLIDFLLERDPLCIHIPQNIRKAIGFQALRGKDYESAVNIWFQNSLLMAMTEISCGLHILIQTLFSNRSQRLLWSTYQIRKVRLSANSLSR